MPLLRNGFQCVQVTISAHFTDLIGSGGQSRVYSARLPLRNTEATTAAARNTGCQTQRQPAQEHIVVKVSKAGKRACMEHEVAVVSNLKFW